MTDITDEQIKQWATEAELASWKPRMNGEDLYPRHPTLEKFRRFAELARQDEREACATLCDELGEMNKLAPTDSAWQWGECAAAIRARGSDK